MLKKVIGVTCIIVLLALVGVLIWMLATEQALTEEQIPVLGGIAGLALASVLLLKKDGKKKDDTDLEEDSRFGNNE